MSATDPEREGGPDAEHQPPSEEPAPLDIDTAFAAIVAGWSEDSPDTGAWPALENLAEGESSKPATDLTGPGGESFGAGPEWPDAAGNRLPPIGLPERELSLEPEEFVPPDPGPLPRGDLLSRTAWAGVIGGPLFLLIAVVAWRTAPQLLELAAIVAFVGGFVILVSRMPKHRDDDDDDGAVV